MTTFEETKQRLTYLLGDGRWRSSAELWRETQSEPTWTSLASVRCARVERLSIALGRLARSSIDARRTDLGRASSRHARAADDHPVADVAQRTHAWSIRGPSWALLV